MYKFNLNFIPERDGIYIVGGSVRDAILGYRPKDYDIAVTGNALAVAAEIANHAGSRVVHIGKPGKTVYRVAAGDHTYDVSPSKAPVITEDLKKRDFTINAIAFDVYRKSIIDPLGGMSDLDTKTVRMVCPEAFKNDPVRLLRAFRIAAVLDFEISGDTVSEIRYNAGAIKTVAGERIREEWLRLLETPASFSHIMKMADTGLLEAIFPEMRSLRNCGQNFSHHLDVFNHSLAVYHGLEKALSLNTPPLSENCTNAEMVHGPCGLSLIKHAALLHDVGKPAVHKTDENGNVHFYGHERTGALITQSISERLRFSTRQKDYVQRIIQNHLRPLFLFSSGPPERKPDSARTRFFIRTAPLSIDLILLFIADMSGKQNGMMPPGMITAAREAIAAYFNTFYPKYNAPPLVTGHDVMNRFGLCPSPFIAELLEKIETQRLSGHVTTKTEALKAAENYIKSKNRP